MPGFPILPSVALLALMQVPAVPTAVPAGGPPLAWAAVSIHESKPDSNNQNYGNDQADGFTAHGMLLRELISQGYKFDVMPFREEEIAGLPDWARTQHYDIVARVDPEDVEAFKKLSNLSMQETIRVFTSHQTTGEMLMFQHLLQERFHLQVHWTSKEQRAYALEVAKGGPHMKTAADPDHGEMSFSRGHLSGKGVPCSFLASLLAIPAERSIVDRTGLTQVYDFDLHFRPPDAGVDENSGEPDFFTAVREQLGLKLTSIHAPLPVLVVDHVEPPTAN